MQKRPDKQGKSVDVACAHAAVASRRTVTPHSSALVYKFYIQKFIFKFGIRITALETIQKLSQNFDNLFALLQC